MMLLDLFDSGGLLAPVASANEAEVELIALAKQIRDWQKRSKFTISDEAMVRTYPGLGSTKTYRRLREGNLESLVAESHLPKYRGVWALIEAASGANGAEDIYEDLTPAMECCTSVAGLIPQRGKTRLLLIEGPSGSGKSCVLGIIARKYAGQVALTEAHEGWQSLACALGDILLAIGGVTKREDLPASKGERLALVIEKLNAARRILLIDESHHCTAAVLNALKTILNRTDSLIVMAGVDTLWRKLTARNWEEARQLIHNRAYDRIRLTAPATGDVVMFLERRLRQVEPGALSAVAGKLAVLSQHCGHYAFLRRIAEAVNGQPDAADAGSLLKVATDLKASLESR